MKDSEVGNSQPSFTSGIENVSNGETTYLGKDVWILPELKYIQEKAFQSLSHKCTKPHLSIH